MKTKEIRILHLLIIMPLLTLLFLSKSPKKLSRQIPYICKWVLASSIIEWIGQRIFKMIYFTNGWHIGWSICIYIKMYSFSLLMTKKPLITWFMSVASTVCFVYVFKVPVKENLREYYKEMSDKNEL
ncbi:MAG: CBO0543 family protein [Bacillota bacterium]|nr:CBO0543 family protein [Bacillota bacterium]